MDVGQKHGTITRRRHRTNAKRGPHQLAVDHRRPCVPMIAACYGVEPRQTSLRAIRIDAEDICVFGSKEVDVPNGYAARKVEFALRYLRPFAISGSSAERMPANDCEHASTSIGHQAANRWI